MGATDGRGLQETEAALALSPSLEKDMPLIWENLDRSTESSQSARHLATMAASFVEALADLYDAPLAGAPLPARPKPPVSCKLPSSRGTDLLLPVLPVLSVLPVSRANGCGPEHQEGKETRLSLGSASSSGLRPGQLLQRCPGEGSGRFGLKRIPEALLTRRPRPPRWCSADPLSPKRPAEGRHGQMLPGPSPARR